MDAALEAVLDCLGRPMAPLDYINAWPRAATRASLRRAWAVRVALSSKAARAQSWVSKLPQAFVRAF